MIGKRYFENAGLNNEISPNYTIVEIGGSHRVLVENHLGVRRYESCCICVNTGYGYLQVNGSCLCLSYMTKEKILIRGNIDAVNLVQECSHG